MYQNQQKNIGKDLFKGNKMIGYILENKLGYLKTLIFTLLGNLLGTISTALLILNTRISNISIRAREMAIIKISDNYLSIFILSIFVEFLCI